MHVQRLLLTVHRDSCYYSELTTSRYETLLQLKPHDVEVTHCHGLTILNSIDVVRVVVGGGVTILTIIDVVDVSVWCSPYSLY